MSARKLIAAVALMSVAATARAGFVSAISEPATVTLVFIALATLAFVCTPRKQPVSLDA